jgi:hypothetical protein
MMQNSPTFVRNISEPRTERSKRKRPRLPKRMLLLLLLLKMKDPNQKEKGADLREARTRKPKRWS